MPRTHGVAGVLLGTLALVPIGIVLAFLTRGVLYGLFDPGPYGNSWGGPSLVGAWAAHFLVSLPFAILALYALRGIAALHRRLDDRLRGDPTGRWAGRSDPNPLARSLPMATMSGTWRAAKRMVTRG